MTIRKMLVIGLVLVLAVSLLGPAALAGKKKKKGPKPWKSEEGVIAVPHTMLISSSGDTNNVTLKEFENRCEIPASNGFDGYVLEVPKEYQKIQADIVAQGVAGETKSFYIVMYDKDCQMKMYLNKSDAIPSDEGPTEGIMPAGIAYLGLANFFGHPAATVWVELKPQ